MTAEELNNYASAFNALCVDIGTGDGKRLYRTAKADPDTLYIGIDPVKENMLDTVKKASKKPEKGGLKNLLLVVGAVESMPAELHGMADEVTVYFPWGSLLESVVKPIAESMLQIRATAKPGAAYTIVTTYQSIYEGAEIEKRGLPELSKEYFETEHASSLKELGFITEEVTELTPEDVQEIGTQWAKRLGNGRSRQYYSVKGKVENTLDL